MINSILEVEGRYLQIGKFNLDLGKFSKIYVVSIGKCSVKMFSGLEKILKEKINSGIVISTDKINVGNDRIGSFKGDHPFPGSNSLKAGRALSGFLKKVENDDLLISLISGGASSLVVLPPKNISIDDVADLNRVLVNSGASIEEINVVRKHCSLIKGGFAAKIVYPAKIINIIVSDTGDSSHSTVGSGLFAWDNSSFRDAVNILNGYKISKSIPSVIVDYLNEGVEGEQEETPSSNSRTAVNNSFFIAGDNETILRGIKDDFNKNGISTEIVSSGDSGNVSEKAFEFGRFIKKVMKKRKEVNTPSLFLSGGEYTVEVKGEGKGGRNTEFVLALLHELKNVRREFFAFSLGSDGIDGLTDAAGAWIDESTFTRNSFITDKEIDYYLKNNDSYSFFNRIGQLIKTGPTGTNVMDIRGVYIP